MTSDHYPLSYAVLHRQHFHHRDKPLQLHKYICQRYMVLFQAPSLRLPQHLLDALKVAANARDVPYQSLIKVWLQEKVHSHNS